MLAFILMVVITISGLVVEAGPYYRGPTYSNTYFNQGYRTPYRTSYRNPYQRYGNIYAEQPSYGYGINYDSYGNSFLGTRDNGIYLLCNGRGCPGRG